MAEIEQVLVAFEERAPGMTAEAIHASLNSSPVGPKSPPSWDRIRNDVQSLSRTLQEELYDERGLPR